MQFVYHRLAAALLPAVKSFGFKHGVPRADGDAMLVGRTAAAKP
jgi:RNase adaptor protein for sRNA GlmZ degradation